MSLCYPQQALYISHPALWFSQDVTYHIGPLLTFTGIDMSEEQNKGQRAHSELNYSSRKLRRFVVAESVICDVNSF